jgi:hypothetical protein
MLGRKGETSVIRTVTVIGSSVAASPEGVVAIVLETTESVTAFQVTLDSIAALRRDLAAAESILLQKPGQA